MITYIQCVKSKAELSIQEFRDQWEKSGRLAEALADKSGAVGLFMNTTLQVEENLEIRLNRGTSEPFDGVLRFCWPIAAGLPTDGGCNHFIQPGTCPQITKLPRLARIQRSDRRTQLALDCLVRVIPLHHDCR